MGIVVWWLHNQSGQSYVGISCMLVECLTVVKWIILMILLTLVSTSLWFPGDDAEALKHVGILMIYNVLVYMYIHMLCIFWSGQLTVQDARASK